MKWDDCDDGVRDLPRRQPIDAGKNVQSPFPPGNELGMIQNDFEPKWQDSEPKLEIVRQIFFFSPRRVSPQRFHEAYQKKHEVGEHPRGNNRCVC